MIDKVNPMKFSDYFKSVPVLETDRLILRPFCRGDMDEYLSFVFTPEVQRYLGGGILSYNNETHIVNWLNNINGRLLKSKTVFTWCVEYIIDKKVIGRVDLGGFNKRSIAELSYHFSKDYWNMGFAKESIAEVIRFGMEDLKLHRIQALVMPDNIYSVKALKGLGFLEEGLLHKYPFGKEFHDAVMLAIIEEQNIGINK